MTSSRTLFIDDIAVAITYKRVKTIRLRVDPLSDVVVSAPYGTDDELIASMVRSRRGWIEQERQAFQNSLQAKAARATKEEQQLWKDVVQACTPPLVKEWEAILGVHVSQLTYRNMKSRWGSCQPLTGKVCINTRLALYPPECLEYVVVHELCHLLISNHGPDFKGLLDRVMPDWRERNAKLRG